MIRSKKNAEPLTGSEFLNLLKKKEYINNDR